MTLEGYQVVDVTPWEGASMGKAIRCATRGQKATASYIYEGKPDWYDLAVQYFDQNNGKAAYRVYVGSQLVDEWAADNDLPTRGINSHSSSRRTIAGVALRTGDTIRIEGRPDGGESAAIDYVEILPHQD